jgi:[ribosomal protein S18]-alanine N-acetyltransferase
MLSRATTDDLDDVAALHAQCFTPGWSIGELADFVEHDHILTLNQHEWGQALLAMCVLRIVAGEAEIITIGVAPNQRRHGIGTEMLKDVLEYCTAQGVSRVFLEVAIDNLAALALYRHAGFEQIGLRKGYYDRGATSAVDALVLARNS